MEKRLWRYCTRKFHLPIQGEHGIEHWKRVAAFGDMLHKMDPKTDLRVIKAFACLHDVERLSDGEDLQHGPNAASLVKKIQNSYLRYLTNEQKEQLFYACSIHTSRQCAGPIDSSYCKTVNACLDADRLDLLRCGIIPDPERMASMNGAKIAAREDFSSYIWPNILNLKTTKIWKSTKH